jgi:hypothetical protein
MEFSFLFCFIYLQIPGVESVHDLLTRLDAYLIMVKTHLEELTVNNNTIDHLFAWLQPITNVSPKAFSSTSPSSNEQESQIQSFYESSIENHIASIISSLFHIARAEMSHRLRHFQSCPRESNVTSWYPAEGRMSAQVCLPFPVTSWTDVVGRFAGG